MPNLQMANDSYLRFDYDNKMFIDIFMNTFNIYPHINIDKYVSVMSISTHSIYKHI